MITRILRGHRKMALLAAISAAFLTPVMFAGAQTITPQLGDLILGFHATGGVGQALNLEVDLGSISNLYNAAPNSVIPLPELSLQDISDTYGASWSTRTDLFWGAVATTGRGSGTPDGHAPLATLWATDPTGQAAWNRGSTNAQKTASATIETVFVPGANGSLYGATATSNSSAAASIAAALPGSWSSGDLKIGGTSFGYFNPTIDGAVTNGTSVLGLYELQPGGNPGTNPGTDLGQLVLSPSGLSFVAVPEASTGILVALGIGTTLLLRRRRD